MRPCRTLKTDPQAVAEFLPIALQGFPNPKRRIDRALGMVLMGDRRSKQRHDAITPELVHGALVAVHLGQHQLEGAIHQAMDFFLGLKPFGERGKARNIHEEDRHLLALPF